LLKDINRRQVSDWIDQLLSQKFLVRHGEFPVLKITESGWQVLRGEVTPTLMITASEQTPDTRTKKTESWEGVDRGLFEKLRGLRTEIAKASSVPAFVIFSDATLRELARCRPVSTENLLAVHGIGRRKADDYGERIMEMIQEYCEVANVATNVPVPRAESRPARKATTGLPSAGAIDSFRLFDAGLDVAAVATKMNRALSTVHGYLDQYIRQQNITDPDRWVDAATTQAVEAAAAASDDSGRLRPIFEALEGAVPYETIRIVLACQRNRANSVSS
jgi:ATP-dependent DNA helicase RecQ